MLLVLYKSCPWFTSYFDSSYFTEPQTALLKPKIHQIIGYCPSYKEPTSPRWLSSHYNANIQLYTEHPNISLQKIILFIFTDYQTKVCIVRY